MIDKPFNAVDITAVIVVAAGIVFGLRGGLTRMFFPLVSVGAMLSAAVSYYHPVAEWCMSHTRLQNYPETAFAFAFSFILFSVWIICLLVKMIGGMIMKIQFNEKINRPGGGIAGILYGILLSISIVIAAGLWPNPFLRRVFIHDSVIGRTVFRMSSLMAGENMDQGIQGNDSRSHRD